MATGYWFIALGAIPRGAYVLFAATAVITGAGVLRYLRRPAKRSRKTAIVDERRQQELNRAARIAEQLDTIGEALRHDLAAHHAQIAEFKQLVRQTERDGSDQAWQRLCAEAENLLVPTMQLTHQLLNAREQVREHSAALETFTRGRIDPLTGVGNARALGQQLQLLLTAKAKGNIDFSVVLVSLDRAAAAENPSASLTALLPRLAGVIRACARDTDFVARYGEDEFVVLLPQATLTGTKVFTDRLRRRAVADLDASVCCGLAEAQAADDPRTLLARADSALYSEKASGPDRTYLHCGAQIVEHSTAIPLWGEQTPIARTAAPADTTQKLGVPSAVESEHPAAWAMPQDFAAILGR